VWRKSPHKRYSSGHPYLKDKDLTLAPFQVAIGAERIGYYVRSIISEQAKAANCLEVFPHQ